MNVVRKWKKLFVVGCSHGGLIDPIARKSVLDFRQRFKPDKTIHLGDFVDTAAFRSGAKGTSDESEPVSPDFNAGLTFLKELRPNLIFCGNHESRIWRLAQHHNAIISELSQNLIERIQTTSKICKAELVEDWGSKSWRKIGNFKFGHGYLFGEQFLRDTAESHGNCVVAHAHRAGQANARRDDSVTAYCVGTLCDVPRMDYASARRSTLSWSAGFVWGEYCDDRCQLYLHQQPQGEKEWRLPI